MAEEEAKSEAAEAAEAVVAAKRLAAADAEAVAREQL